MPDKPAFAGEGLNLAPNLEPLADEVADLVEDFGQVAARLPLQDDGRGEEPQVEVRHAVGHFFDRLFQRHAQVLGLVAALEFGGDRGAHFVGDQLEARTRG